MHRCALETLQSGTNRGKTARTLLSSLAGLDAATQPAYFYDSAAQLYLKLFSNTDTSLLVQR